MKPIYARIPTIGTAHMGDIVQFRPKKKEPTTYDAFETAYRSHYDVVVSLTDSVITELTQRLDIEKAHAYDTFMLREAIMSLVMRQKNEFHPLQEFTEDFVESFGEQPKEM